MSARQSCIAHLYQHHQEYQAPCESIEEARLLLWGCADAGTASVCCVVLPDGTHCVYDPTVGEFGRLDQPQPMPAEHVMRRLPGSVA